ncbi:hypothetical protein C8R42DRAFT_729583 [Lentinula raphanica]|nr:hypothetical protein C8R42DRAFT_729583 [Lentinula raphanica]
MSTQPLYELDDDDNQNAERTQPPSPLQHPSHPSSRLSEASVWSNLSDWDPYIVQMDSEKPFCVPAMYDGPGDTTKPGGFYNVYVGDLPGCYRDWASAGSRVSGYPNNHHKKYKTYEEAMEGWKQYCLAHHQHSRDFVTGTVYQLPRALSAPPSSIPPQSNHNVVVLSSPKKHPGEKLFSAVESSPSRSSTPAKSTPAKKLTRVSKSPTKPHDLRLPESKASLSKLTSPSLSISSTSSLSSASMSGGTDGPANYYGSPSAIYTQLSSRRRLWAIHTRRFNYVASAEEADRVLREGGISGESVLVHEVESIVEAERWLDSLEEAD